MTRQSVVAAFSYGSKWTSGIATPVSGVVRLWSVTDLAFVGFGFTVPVAAAGPAAGSRISLGSKTRRATHGVTPVSWKTSRSQGNARLRSATCGMNLP